MVRMGWITAILMLLMIGATPAVHPRVRVDHLARAFMRDGAGRDLGIVDFEDLGGVVRIRIGLQGLPPGWHGLHIHGVGDCAPPAFASAGDHFNPSGASHPNHAGDLPLMYVISDGTVDMRVQTDRFALADLFDADGSAVIVYANPDNYAHIPDRYRSTTVGAPSGGPDNITHVNGDVGARIACGIVVR